MAVLSIRILKLLPPGPCGPALRMWAAGSSKVSKFTSPIVIRLTRHHKYSDTHLPHTRHVSAEISAFIRRYYNSIEGETEEETSLWNIIQNLK